MDGPAAPAHLGMSSTTIQYRIASALIRKTAQEPNTCSRVSSSPLDPPPLPRAALRFCARKLRSVDGLSNVLYCSRSPSLRRCLAMSGAAGLSERSEPSAMARQLARWVLQQRRAGSSAAFYPGAIARRSTKPGKHPGFASGPHSADAGTHSSWPSGDAHAGEAQLRCGHADPRAGRQPGWSFTRCAKGGGCCDERCHGDRCTLHQCAAPPGTKISVSAREQSNVE
jgi:hypothetical protein